MLRSFSLWVLCVAASSAMVVGCRVARPRAATAQLQRPGAGAVEPSEEDLSESYAHYGAGVVAEIRDEPAVALEEYCQAALKNPGDESLVLDVSRRLILERQMEKALELLTRATAVPGASGALYARLGLVYARLDKVDPAIKANRRAIRLEPRLLAGYQNLFLNYLGEQDLKSALALLDDAAKVRGTSPEFLIGLAELYANYGLQVPAQKAAVSTRALALLQRASQSGNLSPPSQLKLADGFELLGQEDQAAEIYKSLIAELPENSFLRETVRAKLANIYLGKHDPKLAAEQLEALVRNNPTDIQAYYWLGRIASDAKDYDRAADYFSKTLLLKPDFEIGYYELARAQLGAEQNREALDTLETVRTKFSETFALDYLSALACMAEKDFTNAVRHFAAAEVFAEAQDTNRLTSDFYFQFGAACEREGDYEQAETHLEKCLKLAPDDAEALNYLGFMWADRGQKLDQAREFIEKALKADPQNAAYLDSMGWVLFKLRQPERALDYLLQAVQVSEPPDPTLYDHLGDIYATLGKHNKALEAWNKSLSLEPNEKVQKKVQETRK